MVIPAYDAEAYLAETLEGILRQTRPVADCVVVDDGSTDGTARIAEEAAKPVRVVRQSNTGVAAARNRGVSELSTPWVAFCDADDVWYAEKIERQMASLAGAPEAVAALAGAERIGPDGEKLDGGAPELDLREVTLCELIHHRPEHVPLAIPSTLLASRRVISSVGPWAESLSDAADWEYLIRVRTRGPLAGPVEPLVGYRVHGDAMSTDVEGRVLDIRRLYEKLRSDQEIQRRCGKEFSRAWGWQVRVMAASLWRSGRKVAALRTLLREIPRHPAAVLSALLGR